MRHRIALPGVVFGLACTLLLAAGVRADEVRAYSDYLSTVKDNLVLAGSLDLEALRESHDGTIRVVDLRTEPEGTPEEAAAAAALGLEYTNIPVSSAIVDATQVAALRGALEQAGEGDLVVVHCATGNRAGLLWGATQLEAGVSLEQVREEVSGIVTSERIVQGLEAYAQALDAGL